MTLIFFVVSAFSINGQNASDKIVSIQVENKTLIQVLYEMSNENDVDFYFEPEDLPYYKLEGRFDSTQIFKILQTLTNGTNLITLPKGEQNVLLVNRDKVSPSYIDNLIESWQNGTLEYPISNDVKKVAFTFGKPNPNNKSVMLNLNINDGATGEPIVGAVLRNDDLSVSDVSGLDGEIILPLNPQQYVFSVSYTGYHTIELDISIFEDSTLDLKMDVQSILLVEVEIVANSVRNKLDDSRVGAEVINLESIERIPQALGEVDIIKSLEILPGVTSVGDISVGFNVRGGNVDESLVLFNDGMIFNPTHIVGFISAFNAESISKTTLYKGYVDGEFGNRSSAVLDITADAENVKSFKGKGGLGTSLMKVYLQDTISNKLRYNFSARGSFNDYLLNLIANIKIKRSNASFYDVNGSVVYDISDDQTLIFSGYRSDDFFEFNDEFGFEWQNEHVGLKLKSKWSDNFFSKLSLNYGSYKSNQFVINSPEASDFESSIQYLKLLFNGSYQLLNDGYLKGGVELIDYKTGNDMLSPRMESTLVESSIQRKSSSVISPFLTLNYKLFDNLIFETSLRISNYFSKGPGLIYNYEGDIQKEDSIISFDELSGNDPEGKYTIVEPRASLNFKLNDNNSIRGGYNKMSQNLIQVTTSGSALPSDFWVFSDRYIPPQVVDQYSIGFFNTNDKSSYNFSLEGFVKEFQDLRSLKQFPRIILNEHIETEFLKTKGSSYGLEVLLEKNKGKWVGSLAYTFSRSFRQTIDEKGALNGGERFPSDFDIPHQLNLIASYKWLPTVSLSFAYVYKSGRPTTLPTSTILQDGFLIPIYSGRNQTRIPYYSRLDFSITLDMRKAKQTGFRNSFNLGFYNVLKRRNAFNVFFRRSTRGNITPFQFSIIGTLVPNFTWNFTF
ncbi:MAG: hypothetical protein HKN51_05080 [Saprospiraceae bacterium]|nr:hypothetical protein [Saprospiraceae bacterium]